MVAIINTIYYIRYYPISEPKDSVSNTKGIQLSYLLKVFNNCRIRVSESETMEQFLTKWKEEIKKQAAQADNMDVLHAIFYMLQQ